MCVCKDVEIKNNLESYRRKLKKLRNENTQLKKDLQKLENMHSMKSQQKEADKNKAKQLIILNSEDLQTGLINVKDKYI